MNRPTTDQINAACAILKQHTIDHSVTASDTMLANTVYSIAAALGGAGQPAERYAQAIKDATAGAITVTPMLEDHGNGTFTVTAENPMGLPVGNTYAEISDDAEEDEDEDENMTVEELERLNKDDLIAQIEKEGTTLSDDDKKKTKAEIIKLHTSD